MQQLRADQAALGLNRLADWSQVQRLIRVIHARSFRVEQPLGIWRKPARHQNRRLAARSFGVKGDLFGETVRLGFQPGVHRPHDNTVSQHVPACADGRKHGPEAFSLRIFHCERSPQNFT